MTVKEAKLSDTFRAAFAAGRQMARAKRPEIIGATAGALIATGLGALSVKRWKGGKQPSFMEQDAADMRRAQAKDAARFKAKGLPPTYSHKVQNAVAGAYQGVAKAMAEHPVAGSLTIGASGASLGADIATMMRSWT